MFFISVVDGWAMARPDLQKEYLLFLSTFWFTQNDPLQLPDVSWSADITDFTSYLAA